MKLLSPSEIAASIGVSVRTVQRLARAGFVPGAKRDGYHYIYEQTPMLLAWIRDQKRRAKNRGNQRGVATRKRYDPYLWRMVQRNLPASLVFIDWIEAHYSKLPPPRRPLDEYTADDWRSLPLPKRPAEIAELAKGALAVRAAAKIAKKLLDLGLLGGTLGGTGPNG